jgi:hypothetical protein
MKTVVPLDRIRQVILAIAEEVVEETVGVAMVVAEEAAVAEAVAAVEDNFTLFLI